MTQSTKRGDIDFIPNDPLAESDDPMRVEGAHNGQNGKVARFRFPSNAPDSNTYRPETMEFLYWQSREAALAALDAFTACAGPLAAWAPEVRGSLEVVPNAGDDLNAYYDRRTLSFFVSQTRDGATCSGASTDVVSHETGHAILDSLRPEFWNSALPEHAAFHEAFGDCMAILTALNDDATRMALLGKRGGLDAENFVESLAEELSNAVRRTLGPSHPASKPRHALNSFRWQLPSRLPSIGGPDILSGEVHSFARIFTGCFYDTIRNIFSSQPSKSSADLGNASKIAGKLLIAGARSALERPRLFEEVGIAMLVTDQSANGGQNSAAIRQAFEGHGIALTVTPRIHQTLALAGTLSGRPATSEVSLSGLHPLLDGVVAEAPVLPSGESRTGYSVINIGSSENPTTEEEVRFFVRTLLARGSISFESEQTKKATHSVRLVGSKRVLQRIRFHASLY
jgi:hypothetical protein